LAAAYPNDLNVQTELADEYFRTAAVLQNVGDFDGALNTLKRAEPFMLRIAAGQSDPNLQDRIAGLYYYTGSVLEKRGDSAGALQNYRKGASIHEPIATGIGANLLPRTHLVGDYMGIARMLSETGHVEEAVPVCAKALSTIKGLSQANPNNARLREYVAESYDILGDLLDKKNDLSGALENHRQANQIFRELMSVDPDNQLAAENFVFSDLSIGKNLVRQGKTADGIQNIREALATFRAAGRSKNLWDTTGLSSSYSELGMAYAALAERAASPGEKMRHWSEARSWYQKGLEVWSEKPNRGALDALGRNQTAEIAQQLAKCDANLRELKARAQVQ
jgi:tetratricopeptide (TPR) repeat protein